MDCIGAWRGATITQVALFGGSFDPPHLGHVAMVTAAQAIFPEAFELWIIPVGIPVHRTLSGHVHAEQRLRWVQQVFADIPGTRVIDWESERKVATPTIDTLQRLHRDSPGITPWLVLGADACAGLEKWVGYPDHQRLCSLLIFPRSGVAIPTLQGWERCEAFRPETGLIYHAATTPPAISSTAIRKALQVGKPLQGQLPEQIRADIEEAYRSTNKKFGDVE